MGGCRYEDEFGVDVGGSGFRVVRRLLMYIVLIIAHISITFMNICVGRCWEGLGEGDFVLADIS